MSNISVVVPFYNAEKYIQDCIESLLSQEFPKDKYEMIFVDNNSTDASANIVKHYPRIKYVPENRQSPYAARNRGTQEASGEIIAFTDPDCIVYPDWLTEIEKALTEPELLVVLGHNLMGNDSFLLSMLHDYENQKEIYTFGSSDGRIYFAHTNNMAVRRRLFNDLGYFIERERGSDTIFINNLVNKYSTRAVEYRKTMRVRHMEIERPLDFYKKNFIYGFSMNQTKQIVNFRSISFTQRLAIYRNVIRKEKYSYSKSMALIALLFVGAVFWQAGVIWGRFNRYTI